MISLARKIMGRIDVSGMTERRASRDRRIEWRRQTSAIERGAVIHPCFGVRDGAGGGALISPAASRSIVSFTFNVDPGAT